MTLAYLIPITTVVYRGELVEFRPVQDEDSLTYWMCIILVLILSWATVLNKNHIDPYKNSKANYLPRQLAPINSMPLVAGGRDRNRNLCFLVHRYQADEQHLQRMGYQHFEGIYQNYSNFPQISPSPNLWNLPNRSLS